MKKLFIIPLLSIAFAEEQSPSEWNTDLAYGCWADKHSCANLALLHVQGRQRLLPGAGTWLRAELSGSWALDKRGVSHADDLLCSSASGSHADYFGPHFLYLPELALEQHFADGRVCLAAGMLNLTNDVDAVGIANDSFATFAHGALVNSSVLPLPDSNAGAVLRAEITGDDSAVLAVSRTGSPPGGNPFRSGPPGCCVVGEYAHVFQETAVTIRINPFYNQHHAGIAGSAEYEPCDHVSLFVRAGSTRNTADFSCGATFKPIPSRPDDFLGIAYACTKNDGHENVWEVMYNFQIAEHLKLMPHVQYTYAHGGGAARKTFISLGIQAVLSF